MSSELYHKILLMYGAILFIAFVFYTLIAKCMLKVNDLFFMQNKKSELSIIAAPLFIFFLFVLFILVTVFKISFNFLLPAINTISFLLSLVMANIIYLIFSITSNTGKELKMFGIKNDKFYEDIYCYKLTLIYILSLIAAAVSNNQTLMNYLMVCIYPLLFGYYKTYNFLGNIKVSYIETFITNKLHKELKIKK